MSSETSTDQGLPAWQFFLLGGMLAATAVVIVSTGQTLPNIIILSLTILAVSLVALGVLRTFTPLVTPEGASVPAMAGGRTRAALEREKTLVLRAIKDLEFDRSMGKVSEADFDQVGGRLRARAIGLMQQLDRGEYRAQIERELTERLGNPDEVRLKPEATEVRLKPDATEVRLKPDATEGRLKPDATCPSCNTTNDADARFCKQCGTRLHA